MRAHDFLPKKPRAKKARRWHVGDHAILFVEGIGIKCIRANKHGYVMAPVDDPRPEENTFPVSIEEFDNIKDQHSFRFEKQRMTVDQSLAILSAPVKALMELSKEKREYVQWQVRGIRMFLAMVQDGSASRYDPMLIKALRTIQRNLNERSTTTKRKRGGRGKATLHKLVGPKQFLIWVDNYIKMGPLGLVPRYHESGRHGARYTPEEYAKLFEYVGKHLKPEMPSVAMLHRDMVTEIALLNVEREKKGLPLLNAPGRTLLGTEIAKIPAFDKMAAHKGEPYAINYFRASRGGVQDLVRPFQRVEADEWRVHLHTLAIELGLWDSLSPELQAKATAIRAWLAAAMCCASRVLPALVIAPDTGAQNMKQILRMALSDKIALGLAVGAETPWDARGNIDRFVFDGGSSNVNDDVQFICEDLGIEGKCPQAERPTQRGKIERFFQTLDIKSIARFSGRTFGNIVKKGKYETQARACVTVNELCALMVRFILDEYHNAPHAGLGGEAPRKVFLDMSKKCPPTLPPDRNKIRITFGEEMKAKLSREGIRVFGNFYWSASVQKVFEDLGNVEVDICVDTEDLGAISIAQDVGWLTVLGPEEMDGVSLKTWEEAQEDLRRQNLAFQEMVRPVVQRAIAYAMKADVETRKRLLIQYQPMTGYDFERAQRKAWIAIPKYDLLDRVPERQPDLFAGKVKVGTKPRTPREVAPNMAARPPEDAAPTTGSPPDGAAPKPVRTRAKRAPAAPAPAPASKSARRWAIKDRKS